MIGRVIGTYKIVAKLGEGGMGAVYKGIDTMLDREVAIKALKPELASQTAIVERFRKEAVTLAKLHHPNIATLYAMFRHGEELFMVLEYVRGQCLDEIISRRGAMDANEVMPVFCQILDGINHAHEFGIIHRDIKPGNMILTENGTLKVLDFGIARLLGSNRMTRAGNIIGTLEYMAPEQVKGLDTDARSDTYALGMMLYEVLTGRTPFDTDNEFELMKMQTEMMPPLPRSVNPNIPVEVEGVIMRSIQKDPDHRFQTAGEFRDAVVAIGYAENGTMRRTTDPGSRTATAIPVSTPPTASTPANTGDSPMKETRFAPQASIPAPQNIKETRLGGDSAAAFVGQTDTEATPSLFSKLTWVHFAIAGSAAAVLLLGLIIIPLVIYSLTSSTPAAANTNGSEKPGLATASTPEPTPERTLPTPNPTSTPVQIVAAPTPEPTPSQVVDPVKENPPTGPRPAPVKKEPAKKPARSREAELRKARCALTGDC
ncbi:MAG: protein kinase [Pyrinomonadaceae bacterium]